MKQSRLMSLVESFANIAIGYAIQCGAFAFFLPFFGFKPSLSDTMLFGLIMTVVSVVRSYFLRRLFEALHIRDPLSPFMLAVAAECRRQREQEGWSTEHDDDHVRGDLARAGACYLLEFALRKNETQYGRDMRQTVERLWPWHKDWWKPRPKDERRDIVRGVALAVAEGEKYDRLKTKRSAS